MPSLRRYSPGFSQWASHANWSYGLTGLLLGLLLGVMLLVMTSCTINEVVLYKTSNYPSVIITPSARVGPS